jgi:hypothetical protein
MSLQSIIIEVIGYIAFVLILGTYYLNMTNKISATSPVYIWGNLIGGLFFVINLYHHRAYPSMILNIVWVLIALMSLLKAKQSAKTKSRL